MATETTATLEPATLDRAMPSPELFAPATDRAVVRLSGLFWPARGRVRPAGHRVGH